MKKHTQSPYESSEISYKPSGIKWLGEIPKHWEICKLNKVSYFINGYAFESSHFDYSFSIPVIRIGDIQNDKIIYHTCLMTKEQENLKNFMIYRGDIVIALSGATTGKFAVCNSNKKAYINQRVAIIRSDIKILKYYLSTFGFVNYIDMLCNGSAQPNISTKEVGNFKIPLPPLQEQKEIAEFLDKKCEKIQNYIDKKQKLITLLQEKKQALINEVVTKGLNPNIEFKNSGIAYLGLIPHHWEIKKLKHICKINPQTNETLPNNFVYIDLESVAKGQLLKEQTINKEQAPSRAQRILQKQDILFQLVRPYQRNNYIFNKNGDYVASTGYAQIRTKECVNFVYYALLENSFVERVILKSTGSNYPAITSNDFADLKIPLPPLQEQEEIAEFLDSKVAQIDSVIEKTKKQIKLIKEYKNTLINEAVCGRINLERK
ncbi:restriction endonuclease subunit S [Campylobacter upsaliensis]|nr:restriction endonuclease subunit S [Campylobacter upsaliensis]